MNLEKAIWGANYLHCDVRSCVVNAHTFGPYCQGWQGSVLIAYLQVKSVILRIRQAMRDRSGPANDAFLLAAGMEKGGGTRSSLSDPQTLLSSQVPGPSIATVTAGDVVVSGKVDRSTVHASQGCVRTAVRSSPPSSTRPTTNTRMDLHAATCCDGNLRPSCKDKKREWHRYNAAGRLLPSPDLPEPPARYLAA